MLNPAFEPLVPWVKRLYQVFADELVAYMGSVYTVIMGRVLSRNLHVRVLVAFSCSHLSAPAARGRLCGLAHLGGTRHVFGSVEELTYRELRPRRLDNTCGKASIAAERFRTDVFSTFMLVRSFKSLSPVGKAAVRSYRR